MKRSKKVIYLVVFSLVLIVLNYLFNSFSRLSDKKVTSNDLINKEFYSLDGYSYINFRLLNNAFCFIKDELIYFDEFDQEENIVFLRSDLSEFRLLVLNKELIYMENESMYFYLEVEVS